MPRIRLATLIATVTCLAALAGACSGCASSAARAEQQLEVSGSTTILPIAEVAAELFDAKHPGTKVLVSGLGSSAGIESVISGSSAIGTSSRDLKGDELKAGLVDTAIAYDAIAVIVNPSNPVRGLTTRQVRDIFTGKIRNWRLVGGADRPILLVNRDAASGTRDAFSSIVLKGEPFDPTAAVLPGTGQVRAVVGQSTGSIGYISLGFVTPQVKALAIDGVQPSPATVKNGTYPIRRTLHFLTKGQPTGLARAFVDFVLSAAVQNEAVAKAGFLPVSQGK
jgi:phosphate transport system substrate-binding protein